jgi:hypothetical protein
MDKDFINLVKRHAEQKRKEALPEVTEGRRKWWVKEVQTLFDRVEGWLEPVITEELVKFERKDLPIDEDMLGPYTVQQATITLDNEVLEMIPLGTVIFGSFGRIDVKGPNGEVMLILEATPGNEETNFVPSDGRWFIVTRADSRRFKSELTDKTFQQLFADLLGINAL